MRLTWLDNISDLDCEILHIAFALPTACAHLFNFNLCPYQRIYILYIYVFNDYIAFLWLTLLQDSMIEKNAA